MFSKKLCKICSILFIFIIFLGTFSVYANNMVPHTPSGGTAVNKVENVTQKIWATAEKIIQVLSVAAIVFAGLRYMFSSADGKADIKNQTIMLIVGAIFVFGAVEIADLIYDVATSVL